MLCFAIIVAFIKDMYNRERPNPFHYNAMHILQIL